VQLVGLNVVDSSKIKLVLMCVIFAQLIRVITVNAGRAGESWQLPVCCSATAGQWWSQWPDPGTE